MPYNITFKNTKNTYEQEEISITNINDDDAFSALKELVKDNEDFKYKYLFNFKPGDICVYTDLENKTKFVLTKVWVEGLTHGFFNAAYADGDVIESGSLNLITKVGSMKSTFDEFMNRINL